MNPLRLSFLTLGFGAVTLAGSAMDLQTLIDRSPFAPPGGAAPSAEAAPPPGTLEFRGMVVDAAGTAYSVFDATANRGYWVREGEDGPIKVKSYNAQENQLEIEQGGRPVQLQLKRATLEAGAPIATSQPNPTLNGRPQRPGGPGLNAATDAKRLEAVAAEVRRRRAMRNAANTGAPGAPGQQPPAPAGQ